MADEQRNSNEQPVHAYQQMMARVKGALEHATTDTLPGIRHYIDHAVDKAVELEELTREEAERVGDYLRRDVHDAAEYLAGNEDGDLKAWMRFDVEQIEGRILGMFQVMVDHTREELDTLKVRAEVMSEWYSDEITGPGTLQCQACGKVIQYRKPELIVPCPGCGGTVFVRVTEEEA